MPLDDNEIAQVKEALTTGTIPDCLKPVADAGFTLYTPTALNTFKESYKGQIISTRDNELYTQYEGQLKEVSGIEKKSGEKYADYLKRAFADMGTELADLKKKAGEQGGLTQIEKERLAQLENQLVKEKEGRTTDKQTYAQQMLGYRVSGEQGAALATIKNGLKKDLTGDLLSDVIQARLDKFGKDYKPELVKDGDNERIIYRDSKNEIVNDDKFQPAGADFILGKLFAPYMDTQHQQGGGGSGGGGGNGGAGGGGTGKVTKETYKPGADVTTRVALSDDLKKHGFAAGSADFTELTEKFKGDMPLGR